MVNELYIIDGLIILERVIKRWFNMLVRFKFIKNR